jgi:cytochrome c biogenesis protein
MVGHFQVISVEAKQTQRQRPGVGYILLEFLGSMNLAITVLVAIAIAAVIGTVLRQNEAYSNYVIEFGPFWFDVFESIGLYDVYKAWWFLLLLGFLLLSTSVCVYRNGPTMLRDMRQYRVNAKHNSLRAMHHSVQWQVKGKLEDVQKIIADALEAQRYRTRSKQHDDHTMLAAMKGSANRLGYLFTHIAMVVICVGALIDGNMPLKLAEIRGQVKIETRDILASKVPEESVLGVDNSAFRGAVNISEGESATIVFLNVRDGYLVQELPFRVELKDFRIEHYPTGQPKSFESDLVIYDKDLPAPLERTISVNHPLIYKGYSIYQASFSDGGSKLKMKLWPLYDASLQTIDLKGVIQGKVPLKTAEGSVSIELNEFRKFNINPVKNKEGKTEQTNYGPNFTFKVRDEAGQAREFVNYMSPIPLDGRLFMMSGMRNTPGQEFRYLYIPVDEKGSVARFMNMRARLLDKKYIEKIAMLTVADLIQSIPSAKKAVREDLLQTVIRTTALFTEGGDQAIANHILQNIPEDKRQVAGTAYFNMLRAMIGKVFIDVLKEEGLDLSKGVSETQTQYFDDAWNAMSSLKDYGGDFYLQLNDFEHVEASGLQITRSPGQGIVYFGCVMLCLGIFMLFYIPQRRYWAWLQQQGDTVAVVFAGMGNRHERDLAAEYDNFKQAIAERIRL